MKFLLCVLLLFPLYAAADDVVTYADTVPSNHALDQTYEQFDTAFRALDARGVANIYSDDALYLGPFGDIVRGREAIVKEMARGFDEERAHHGTISIAFKVVDRRVSGNVIIDTGYFTITRTYANETKHTRGKYVNVFERDRNGTWHLRVDMYNPAG